MKNAVTILAVAAATMVATVAHAAPGLVDAEPGIYGVIDVAKFPKPQVINAKPRVATLPAKNARKVAPIYLHVPIGHENHWHAHCATYGACSVPVYFVTEGWFRSVYLPVLGRDDGREQRYLLQMGRERDTGQRDLRIERADD